MTLPRDIKDLEKLKFVEDDSGNVSVRTNLVVKDIQIGAVEIKDGSTDTRATVESDGTDNALVVKQNSSPLPKSTDMEGNGKNAVGTTAVEVTFTGDTNSIIITSDYENTGILFIGKSDVTSAGANAITFLQPGDSVTLDYDDSTNAVYVVSDTAGQNYYSGALV